MKIEILSLAESAGLPGDAPRKMLRSPARAAVESRPAVSAKVGKVPSHLSGLLAIGEEKGNR